MIIIYWSSDQSYLDSSDRSRPHRQWLALDSQGRRSRARHRCACDSGRRPHTSHCSLPIPSMRSIRRRLKHTFTVWWRCRFAFKVTHSAVCAGGVPPRNRLWRQPQVTFALLSQLDDAHVNSILMSNCETDTAIITLCLQLKFLFQSLLIHNI